MRYLNIKTFKQTQKFIDDATTIIDSDVRVANWFTKCPDGFRAEWVGDTYSFIEIPLPTQAELDIQAQVVIDAENLQALEATDKSMVRIAEDLLDLLVAKGLIAETELPVNAQDNLATRRNARSKL